MEAQTRIPSPGAELISVRIGEQAYAIDIMAVREIRGWSAATPLPHAPSHVLGMMNLRGAILPVIDAAVRLGLPPTAAPRPVIVVLDVDGLSSGFIADRVSDILSLPRQAIEPPPAPRVANATTNSWRPSAAASIRRAAAAASRAEDRSLIAST